MEHLTLDPADFTHGQADEVLPGVRRVIADNPSKFTYHGTGTYIVGRGDVAVIDPGPVLDTHRDALAAELRGETVRTILITHCHADHSPLAAWLAAETGAPTVAYGPHGDDEQDIGSLPDDFGRSPDESGAVGTEASEPTEPTEPTEPVEPPVEESTDRDFRPDVAVVSGDLAAEAAGWTIEALHTPGHTSNHTCYVFHDGDRRVIFTGDHVMGWSTTVVSPPDGDMSAYMESLRLVAGRADDVAVPTHGPPIPDPSRYVEQLIAHRLERERQVLDAVRRDVGTIPAIVTELYAAVRVELHRPAGSSVLAHLDKLVDDGLVTVVGGGSPRLDSQYAAV